MVAFIVYSQMSTNQPYPENANIEPKEGKKAPLTRFTTMCTTIELGLTILFVFPM